MTTTMEIQEVRTDELHKHIGSEIEIVLPNSVHWRKLISAKSSTQWQGWEIIVEKAPGQRVTLQSCFAGTTYAVRSDAWAFGCSGDAARWALENVGLD